MPSAGDVRAVVDTNVLLSGLFWRGKPHALIEQVRAGALSLISSPGLPTELAEVMNRPKFEGILARSNTDARGRSTSCGAWLRPSTRHRCGQAISHDPSADAVLVLVAGFASQSDHHR